MKRHVLEIWQKPIKTSDLRVFLGIWAGIFAVFLAFGILRHDIWRVWAIIGCGVSVALLIVPRVCVPLYRVWLLLGEGIGFCISRSILLLVFVVIFVPVGIAFRIFGRDVLRLRAHKGAESYFITRTTQPTSMERQF